MEANNQNQQPFVIPISAINGMPMRFSQSPITAPTPGLRPITTTYRLVTDGPIPRLMRTPLYAKSPIRYVQRSPAPQIISTQGQGTPRFVVKKQGPGTSSPMKIASNQLRMAIVNNGQLQQLQQHQFTQQQQQQILYNTQQVMPGMQHLQVQGGQKQQMIQVSEQQPGRMIVNQAGKPNKILRKPVKPGEQRPGPAKKSPSVTPPQSVKVVKKSILMRLRCRTRPLPLHSTYYDNDSNEIHEKDADVIFQCGDGGRVRGHKVILASQSKFFTDVFQDQPIGEITTVSIPDISSDVLKLILLLAYKRSVVVNTDQIEKIKEYFDMFGVDFEKLSTEPPSESGPLDVNPGVVVESIQSSINAGGSSSNNFAGGSRRKMMPSFTSEQLENLQHKNKKSVMQPKFDRSHHVLGNDLDGSAMSDDETFKIQGYTNTASINHLERRKAKLTPRVVNREIDIEKELCDMPEPTQGMIDQWMGRVGKDEMDWDLLEGKIEEPKGPIHKCKLCEATFLKESVWKWHQNRHFSHGIYKCTICDILKTTVNTIWAHEQISHNFSELPLEEILEGHDTNYEPKPTSPQKMDSNKIKLQISGKPQINAAVGVKINSDSHSSKAYGPRTYQSSPARIVRRGQPEEDETEVKKIKQSQWLYVCARCENISDNDEKARFHFGKCYAEEEVLFDTTVAKYRQGFYGRSKCPFSNCLRKYVTNGGWTIHVGHQHEAHRKLFSHTGSVEDKIKCDHCFRKFAIPEDFYTHLTNGEECTQSPVIEEVAALSSPVKNSTAEVATTGSPIRKKVSTICNSGDKKEESKDQPIAVKSKPVPVPPSPPVAQPPPRSARLAKRASALLMQKVLHGQDEDDYDDEGYLKKSTPQRKRSKVTPKRRTASITSNSSSSSKIKDYPPIECPICGSEIVDFSQHFSTDHKDMKVDVDRIATDLLKCRQCSMTFGIDDIFGHPAVCGKNKTVESGADDDGMSEVSSTISSVTPTKREAKQQGPLEIPEGMGNSPIEKMVYTVEDLMDRDIILSTMTCQVCKKTGTRMGQITTCLKQHGIFRCSICFNTYSARGDYDRHVKACHWTPGLRAKCPFCPDKAFVNIGQCVGHMHVMHWADFVRAKNQPGRRLSTASSKPSENEPEQEVNGENTANESEKTDKDMEEEVVPNEANLDEQKDSDRVVDKKENDDSKMDVDESKPEDEEDTPAKSSDETAKVAST